MAERLAVGTKCGIDNGKSQSTLIILPLDLWKSGSIFDARTVLIVGITIVDKVYNPGRIVSKKT